MVDVAKEVGADAVSHGCTGKGNDQVYLSISMTCFLFPSCNFFFLSFDEKGSGQSDLS